MQVSQRGKKRRGNDLECQAIHVNNELESVSFTNHHIQFMLTPHLDTFQVKTSSSVRWKVSFHTPLKRLDVIMTETKTTSHVTLVFLMCIEDRCFYQDKSETQQ